MTLAAALGGLVAGIVLGRTLGAGPATLWLAAAGGTGGLAIVGGGLRRVGAVGLAMVCVGSAGMQRTAHGMAVSPLTSLVAEHAVVELRGRLVGDPQTRQHVARVIVRVESIGRVGEAARSGGRRHVQLVASASTANRLAVLVAGDTVVVRAVLGALGSRDRRLALEHVVASGRVLDVLAFADAPLGVLAVANRARAVVLRGIGSMPTSARALTAGFLLGDTSAVPDATVQAFRASGLSHLLAVSGANLAFVAACVAPLLRRLRLSGRFVGGVLLVVLFGAMTRFEPSILRASAMALLVLVADRLGRPAPAVRILALATLALLLADPLLVFRTGFQLSVGATLGIVVLHRPLARSLPGPGWLRGLVAVPLAAQLGVLPIALATFGEVPLVALLANVVAEPLAGPITMLGFVTALVGWLLGPVLPGVAQLVQYPVAGLVGAVDAVARTAGRVPLAVDGRILGVGAALVALAPAWRRPSSGAPRERPLTSGGSRAEVPWPASSP